MWIHLHLCILKFYKNAKKTIGSIKKSTPILIVGGSADSVNNFGRGTLAFASYLKNDFHFNNISTQIYTGARHYIYIDTCKYKLINDIITWNNKIFNNEKKEEN